MTYARRIGGWKTTSRRARSPCVSAPFDAVFMPQHSLPAVGTDAIRRAYQQVFAAIDLNVDFTIDEIGLLSPDWAFARTRSNGTVKVLASDAPAGREANQEIFLLRRADDGQWRFARYIFSTTQPPRHP